MVYTESSFKGFGGSRDLFIGAGESVRRTLYLSVKAGQTLVYAVHKSAGKDRKVLGRGEVRVELIPPDDADGRRDQPVKGADEFGFIDRPRVGSWRLKVIGRAESDTTVSFTVLEKYTKGAMEFFGCNGCKKLLKAFIIVLASMAAGNVNDGAIVATANEFLRWFRKTMEMTDGALRVFMDFLADMITEPIERIMETVCRRLGFCD